MITDNLKTAFRYHLQNAFRPYGDTRLRTEIALDKARADLAANKSRYPAPIKGRAMRAGHDADKPASVYVENPESFGLRLVGRVEADTPRGNVWDSRESSGWYDNPENESFKDGSGLIYGLVYQLPAIKGKSRFVAAYQNGCNDSGALIDFAKVYMSQLGGTWDTAREDDAAREAARHADSIAKSAAESEREYQTAWRAGSNWADLGEEIADNRSELLAILKERKALKGTQAPALCAAITGTVKTLLRSIQKARAKRAKLAAGDSPDLYFYPDDRLQSAFCEGAGLEKYPA